MRYLLLALSLFVTTAQAEVKYLHFKYNDKVIITISNVECPLHGIKQQYDYAVIATRIDGERLLGCYKKQDENYIEVKWYGGDISVLPANAFLTNPELGNKPKPDTSPKTAL